MRSVVIVSVDKGKKKEMSVPPRISSASNLILALIVLLVQVWLAL